MMQIKYKIPNTTDLVKKMTVMKKLKKNEEDKVNFHTEIRNINDKVTSN